MAPAPAEAGRAGGAGERSERQAGGWGVVWGEHLEPRTAPRPPDCHEVKAQSPCSQNEMNQAQRKNGGRAAKGWSRAEPRPHAARPDQASTERQRTPPLI